MLRPNALLSTSPDVSILIEFPITLADIVAGYHPTTGSSRSTTCNIILQITRMGLVLLAASGIAFSALNSHHQRQLKPHEASQIILWFSHRIGTRLVLGDPRNLQV